MPQHLKRLKEKYDFNITKKSVTTRMGTLNVKTVAEYENFSKQTAIILMDRSDLLDLLKSIDPKILNLIKGLHIYEFLKMVKESEVTVFGLNVLVELFQSSFKYLFDDDVLFKINSPQEYDEIILLIKWVHGLPVEMENPNPVIARLDKIKRQMDAGGISIDFDTMYSSIWVHIGQEPCDITLYQFKELFYRISMLKSYETSTLFKTVDTKNDIKIQNWYDNRVKDTKKYVDINKMKNQTF